MSVWYKVAWIPPLFAAVDAVAPARGHAEDGTIGDLAHASGTSGHNPDDTPGVTAERQDADSKPEVRAADVDNGGTWPAGRSMETVVQAVLHGPPAERDRLIYIIYNRRIWKKSNGWRQEAYTGSDPHDRHAHFSGDPAADDNGAPWTSILALEDDMANAAEINASRNSYAITQLQDKYKVFPGDADGSKEMEVSSPLAAAIKRIDAGVAALVGRPAIDPAALAAALAPLLTDHLGVEVSAEQLVTALESERGQAALTAAANRAEDS